MPPLFKGNRNDHVLDHVLLRLPSFFVRIFALVILTVSLTAA